MEPFSIMTGYGAPAWTASAPSADSMVQPKALAGKQSHHPLKPLLLLLVFRRMLFRLTGSGSCLPAAADGRPFTGLVATPRTCGSWPPNATSHAGASNPAAVSVDDSSSGEATLLRGLAANSGRSGDAPDVTLSTKMSGRPGLSTRSAWASRVAWALLLVSATAPRLTTASQLDVGWKARSLNAAVRATVGTAAVIPACSMSPGTTSSAHRSRWGRGINHQVVQVEQMWMAGSLSETTMVAAPV